MAKRSNEDSQLSKEEYEAKAASTLSSNSTGSFSRADEEELKQRKIKRVSAKWKPAANNTSLATPPTSASSNPFSNVKLAASTANTLFSFGSLAAPAPTHSFGTTSTPEGANKDSTKAVSFAPTPQSQRELTSTKNKQAKIILACKKFWKAHADPKLRQHVTKTADQWFIHNLLRLEREQDSAPLPKAMPTVSTPGPSSLAANKGIMTPAATPVSFSFGTATPGASTTTTPGASVTTTPDVRFGLTPAPKAGEISTPFAPTPAIGSALAPTGLAPTGPAPTPTPALTPAPAPAPAPFSFSSTPSKPLFPPAPAESPKIVPFSFLTNAGLIAPFSFAPAPAQGAAPVAPAAGKDVSGDVDSTNDDNGNGNDDDGVDMRTSSDVDWITVNTFRVSVYQEQASVWKKMCTGDLKLQSHKVDASNHRIVMRDDKGLNVHINMKISKSMTFQKGAGTKKHGSVLFTGVKDAKEGLCKFMLQCRMENVDKLRDALEELSKM